MFEQLECICTYLRFTKGLRGDKSQCRTLHFCSCFSRSLLFPLSYLSCLPPLKFTPVEQYLINSGQEGFQWLEGYDGNGLIFFGFHVARADGAPRPPWSSDPRTCCLVEITTWPRLLSWFHVAPIARALSLKEELLLSWAVIQLKPC